MGADKAKVRAATAPVPIIAAPVPIIAAPVVEPPPQIEKPASKPRGGFYGIGDSGSRRGSFLGG